MRLPILYLALLTASASLAATTAPPSPPTTQPATHTRQEIEAMIDKAGRTNPDWWDRVTVTNLPATMDMSWQTVHGAPWNPQKNLGQFYWDVIYPNPRRWEEGAKLAQQILADSKSGPEAKRNATNTLAHIYSDLLQDYPRGAYWTRKTGQNQVRLADCYWKMGCRELAVETLQRVGPDTTRNGSVIKLWADMGDYATALRLADQMARSAPDPAYLAAGDACRLAGQYPKALEYYNKVVTTTAQRGTRDLDRNKQRAQASIQAVKVFDALDLSRIPDGKYTSSSTGYAGAVELQVTVAAGRITDVKVTQHHEKQFYASITSTTAQIIEKQGVKGVDSTSGATITSEAIINASAKALSSAMK